MLDQAINHFQAGNLAQADHLLQEILTHQPENIQALQLSGRIDASRNKFNDAVKTFKKALDLNASDPTLHYDLGIVQKKLGNTDSAITCYQQAIALAPNFAEAYFNLGNTLGESGKLKEAAHNFKQALLIKPNFVHALANLSMALTQLNQLPELATICEQLTKQIPGYFDAHFQLGIIYQKQNKAENAIKHFQKTLEINPQSADSYYWIGVIHNLQGDLNTASNFYNNALRHNPNHINSLSNLCDIYEKLHKLDQAELTAQRTLKLAPNNPTASRVYATLLRRQGKASQGYSILSTVEIPKEPRVALGIHFELGKLCDQNKDYDRAYFHFSEGNKILASDPQTSNNNKERFLKQIKSLSSTFNKPWLDSWNVEDNENKIESPVFLIGFPRSGTTLLDQILDSHPQIEVIEEKPILATTREQLETSTTGYPKSLATLSGNDFPQLRKIYSDTTKQFSRSEKNSLLIDKLPFNIIHAGLCHRLFPNAKYILVLRHPCDACLSCFMQPFSHNDAMANFHNLEDSTKLYSRTMALWQQYTTLLPLNIHTIKYESLIENIEIEARSLLNFLDIPWNKNVLAYDTHAKSRDLISTPSYNQVTQPLYQSSKFRWERYRKFFDPHIHRLEPWISKFDY